MKLYKITRGKITLFGWMHHHYTLPVKELNRTEF
jgi:hypothetical protein